MPDKHIIEPDDLAFIEALVANTHQEIYWRGWVTLYTKANAAAKKQRILLVTNFRVYTIKLGVLKRSARQSLPLLDLEEISASDNVDNHLHVTFNGLDIDIESESAVEIAQSIIFGFKSITYGLPRNEIPKVDLPEKFLADFVPPSPDTQDGILATYLAMCDYVSSPPRVAVLDYFMSAFESQEKEFVLSDCLKLVDKAVPSDILTISSSLRYTNWFEEFTAVDYSVRDDGVKQLACIFEATQQIKKCVLVNVKCGKAGLTALADTLRTGKHGLLYLNLSSNKDIGDGGLKVLLQAFTDSEKALHTFVVQNCGFSTKGFKALVETAKQPAWLEQLKILDVSDNSAGKSGTMALCEWIDTAHSLEQFYAMRCDLNLELFMPAVSNNQQLLSSLQTLNVSGNKVTKKTIPTLCGLLRESRSLAHLYLKDCSLSRANALELLEAAIANPHDTRFLLDLSSNDLGNKGALEIAKLLAGHNEITTLHTLNFSNNGFDADGVKALCESLWGKGIHTLSLDNNIKTGMFSLSKAKEAGDAIGQLILRTPSLRELSLRGDDSHYLQSAAYPVLEAVKQSETLQVLDLSRNRLGDDGLHILCEALKTSRSLTSFNIERNRVGLKGLQELHDAVVQNSTLLDWNIPMFDIEATYQGGTRKDRQLLRSIVVDFEQAMDRNWARHQKAVSASEEAGTESDEKDNATTTRWDIGIDYTDVDAYRRGRGRGNRFSGASASDMLDSITDTPPSATAAPEEHKE